MVRPRIPTTWLPIELKARSNSGRGSFWKCTLECLTLYKHDLGGHRSAAVPLARSTVERAAGAKERHSGKARRSFCRTRTLVTAPCRHIPVPTHDAETDRRMTSKSTQIGHFVIAKVEREPVGG